MDKTGQAGNGADKTRKAVRTERLAAELRANLKRRKAAARERDAGPQAADPANDPVETKL